MKKITELTETRKRTVYYKDAYGNRERGVEEFIAFRPVKSVSQGPRIGHFLADYILYLILLFTVETLLDFARITAEKDILALMSSYTLSIAYFLLYPLYYFFFESRWQKTPGKFLTKTIVIDEYGNKPDLSTIALRSIIRLVPFEQFSCFDDKYSHGWHDRWSKTWVVSEEELQTLKQLQAEQSEQE